MRRQLCEEMCVSSRFVSRCAPPRACIGEQETNHCIASDISSCETNIRLAGRPTADQSPKSCNIEHSLATAHLHSENRDSIGVCGA